MCCQQNIPELEISAAPPELALTSWLFLLLMICLPSLSVYVGGKDKKWNSLRSVNAISLRFFQRFNSGCNLLVICHEFKVIRFMERQQWFQWLCSNSRTLPEAKANLLARVLLIPAGSMRSLAWCAIAFGLHLMPKSRPTSLKKLHVSWLNFPLSVQTGTIQKTSS